MPQLPMQPPQQPNPQPPQPNQAGGQGVAQTVKGMMSILNPTDSLMMVKQGIITQQTTVAELLQMSGIDPNGSIMQLVDKIPEQMRKANPLEKMNAISQSRAPQPIDPSTLQQQQPQPPMSGGLDELMRR